MKIINNENDCVGCGVCADVCPKSCIKMQTNKKGFKYPVINNELCIECNSCVYLCPINQEEKKTKFERIGYAAKSIDDSIRINSSSGGVFFHIASYFLANGGVVVAPVMSDGKLEHTIINNIDNLKEALGSKYIQSELSNVLKQISVLASKGINVLFSGTPCQIAAVKSYLKKDYNNVYFQDIICHGVPSNLVFDEYLKTLGIEKPYKVEFRNKDLGWLNFQIKIKDFNSGESIYNESKKNDLFLQLFLNDIILRDCCHDCKFKLNNIASDLTLGDFWGIETVKTEHMFNDDKGASVILVSSEKGEKLLEEISGNLILEKIDIDLIKNCNKAITGSPKLNKKKVDYFFSHFTKMDLKELSALVLKQSKLRKIINKVLNDIKWEIKIMRNKIIKRG